MSHNPKHKPIQLVYTDQDWEILECMAKKKGSVDFRSYLNNAMHGASRLIQNGEYLDGINCEECEKTNNLYFIPDDILPYIKKLAKAHHIPLAAAVRNYFVEPLIKEFIEMNLKGINHP